jgi:hypothetical protein
VAILVLVAAVMILTQAGDGRSPTASLCDQRAVAAPSVPRSVQDTASRFALDMPLVRRLLDGEPPSRVVIGEQGTRKGTLIGISTQFTLGHAQRVDATWPWLLVDDTETLRPPYQIIQQHVRSSQVWGVTITVLAPGYDSAAVSSWHAGPGASLGPVSGAHDRRPPQPNCG